MVSYTPQSSRARAKAAITVDVVPAAARRMKKNREPFVCQDDQEGPQALRSVRLNSGLGETIHCGRLDRCKRSCPRRVEADTAQRLRAFLDHLANESSRFSSFAWRAGTTSTVMGRLLREREMTAGVYETHSGGLCRGE